MKADVKQILALRDERGIAFVEAERELFGCDHAEVGGAVARHWGFPDDITDAIEHHHQVPVEKPNPTVDAVIIANLAAKAVGTGLGAEGMDLRLDEQVNRRLKLDFAGLLARLHPDDELAQGAEGQLRREGLTGRDYPGAGTSAETILERRTVAWPTRSTSPASTPSPGARHGTGWTRCDARPTAPPEASSGQARHPPGHRRGRRRGPPGRHEARHPRLTRAPHACPGTGFGCTRSHRAGNARDSRHSGRTHARRRP